MLIKRRHKIPLCKYIIFIKLHNTYSILPMINNVFYHNEIVVQMLYYIQYIIRHVSENGLLICFIWKMIGNWNLFAWLYISRNHKIKYNNWTLQKYIILYIN